MGVGFENVTQMDLWFGLWSGWVFAYITEYYTSHSCIPVREIDEDHGLGHRRLRAHLRHSPGRGN